MHRASSDMTGTGQSDPMLESCNIWLHQHSSNLASSALFNFNGIFSHNFHSDRHNLILWQPRYFVTRLSVVITNVLSGTCIFWGDGCTSNDFLTMTSYPVKNFDSFPSQLDSTKGYLFCWILHNLSCIFALKHTKRALLFPSDNFPSKYFVLSFLLFFIGEIDVITPWIFADLLTCIWLTLNSLSSCSRDLFIPNRLHQQPFVNVETALWAHISA